MEILHLAHWVNTMGGYEHNLYQIDLLDKDRILLPP